MEKPSVRVIKKAKREGPDVRSERGFCNRCHQVVQSGSLMGGRIQFS